VFVQVQLYVHIDERDQSVVKLLLLRLSLDSWLAGAGVENSYSTTTLPLSPPNPRPKVNKYS